MRQAQHMGKVQAIHAVTFTPSGRQFVMAATVDALDETGNPYSTCGALILWDIENWSEVLRQRGAGGISEKIDTYYQTFNPVGKFCDLTYTPNGKYLIAAAAGANAGVYYFNNRTNNPAYGICMADLQSEEQRPRTSVTSEFKPNLVQGVSHHDFPNAEMVSITIAPADPNNPEKKPLTIVSADNYGRIVFWDFAPRPNRPREGVTCRNYWSMKNSEHTTRNIRDILYSQDEKFVMVLGDDILLFSGRRPHDYVGTFRLTNDNSVSTLRNDYFLVSGFFTQDNKYFFGGGDDCMLRIWRVDEMPIDSRFLAERPGETTSDEDKATLENIQKELMARGNIGSRDDSDEDEKDWERRVERKNSKPFETDTSIPPRVTGDDASMFRDED